MTLDFQWSPGLVLRVRYRRHVREEGMRPGRAITGRSFTWSVDDVGDGVLRLRPDDVHVLSPQDDRPALPHRRHLDALIDAPPDLRVSTSGTLLGLHDPAAIAASADISTATLRALPADARRLIAGMAHPESLRALAEDLWSSLVSQWIALGTVPTEPRSETVSGQLPVLGTPARFVVTRTAEPLDDGTRLVCTTEVLQADVQAALAARPTPVQGMVVESRITLETDPATLVPRVLEVRRLQQVSVAEQVGSQLDVRTWEFR